MPGNRQSLETVKSVAVTFATAQAIIKTIIASAEAIEVAVTVTVTDTVASAQTSICKRIASAKAIQTNIVSAKIKITQVAEIAYTEYIAEIVVEQIHISERSSAAASRVIIPNHSDISPKIFGRPAILSYVPVI